MTRPVRSDPREELRQLPDTHPILLLPLRLETRFRPAEAGRVPELWVRVYPDDCWIDTFQPDLTAAEVAAGRVYWIGRWAAGGTDAEIRAAWGLLVQAHGAGRAAWIVRSYRPVNAAAEPAGRAADEVVLVIATEAPLTGAEATAAATYWIAVWRAGDDPAGLRVAEDALIAAVGAARAAGIATGHRPANLDVPPPAGVDRPAAVVRVATVVFTDPARVRDRSWTAPARAHRLPQRLRLLAYRGGAAVVDVVGASLPDPLVVGPDPAAPPERAIHVDDTTGTLVVPDELRWLVDFEQAVRTGLGFKVALTAEQAVEGFDRLLVLGVHLGADADAGAKALQTLLGHHRYSSSGFELVPQGSPTNNTDGAPAAFRRFDDPDASYPVVHRGTPLTVDPADELRKPDGQWFAELVGVDPALLESVPNADGADQREARAMNRLLWPATLGHYLDVLLVGADGAGLLTAEAEAELRTFVQRHVHGRGTIPVVRIGRQPYGIVTTTAFSRLGWLRNPPADLPDRTRLPFLRGLHLALERMRQDWLAMSARVPRLGAGADSGDLAAVLGLQAGSVQFHQRYAETADQHHNLLAFVGPELVARHRTLLDQEAAASRQLLARLGDPGVVRPELLRTLLFGWAGRLTGPLVDTGPLSEVAGLPPLPGTGVNYLRWLRLATRTSLDDLRTEHGLDPTPRALLYLLTKFALERGFAKAADDMLVAHGVQTPKMVAARRAEPPFVHVAAEGESESRWAPLYAAAPRITGNGRPLHEHLTSLLRDRRLSGDLTDQLDALAILDVPTARLERALVEHLDCCSYRLDAWLTGLVGYQLTRMRFPTPDRAPRRGVYIGAYGWLQDVRPRPAALQPVTITDPQVAATFTDSAVPLRVDPAGGGYLLAPSLDHAVTASVLRAGYLATADRATPDALAVNLSSTRVRHALELLEGVRTGQDLGALLGYRLERGLHDRHAQPQLQTAISALRAAFPLRAGRLQTTAAPAGTPVEAVEARNVVDGQRLLQQVRRGGGSWPFGATLPALASALRHAVEREVAELVDLYDAVSDLALAEGVHQAVLGNHARAAAALDAFSKGGLPPAPAVVAAPRRGFGLTHRVVLHLDPTAPAGPTPRSAAEPPINAWLAEILPPLHRIGCRVTAIDPATGAMVDRTMTAAALGLAPLDLLSLLDVEADAAMTAVDDALVDRFVAATGLRPDARIAVEHTATPSGITTFFQLVPLVRSLRALLLGARTMAGRDLLGPGDARPAGTVSLSAGRVTGPLASLDATGGQAKAFLDGMRADPALALAGVDDTADALVAVCRAAAPFGIPAAGTGQIRQRRAELYAALVSLATDAAARIGDRLAVFDTGLAEIDALPPGTPDDERIRRLVVLERQVSTVATSPVPATSAALRGALLAKRATLADRRSALDRVGRTTARDLRTLTDEVAAVAALTPSLAELVGESLDVDAQRTRQRVFLDELLRQAEALHAEIDLRVTRCQQALATAAAAPSADQEIAAVQAAGTALFGAAFTLVPTVTPDPAVTTDHAAALGEAGALTTFAHGLDPAGDPVEDWLHGAARVRERLQHWEAVTLLAGPLRRRAGAAEPSLQLTPAQLPRRPDASWLAVDIPPNTVVDHDVLCYTAAGAAPGTGGALCGIVLDEWPEVIPLRDRTAGLAFHFDRPSSEPPQAWLLVTPATWSGRWSWDDLVAALHDTLDLARLRAVEPDHVDTSPYGPLLPTTVFPVYPRPISIMLNLAMNADTFTGV